MRQLSVRFLLRERTAACHQRVDDMFSMMDLGHPGTYRQFLVAQAAAFISVEEALIQGGIAQPIPAFAENRRAPLLMKDLKDLGITPPDPLPAPALDSEAALLGAAYVLEGSRLGGAILRKAVPADLPCRFLGASTTLRWPAFASILNRRLATEAQVEAAVAAAQAVFALFEIGAATALQNGEITG